MGSASETFAVSFLLQQLALVKASLAMPLSVGKHSADLVQWSLKAWSPNQQHQHYLDTC